MTVSISKDIEVDYVKASDIKLRFRLRTPNQERVDELAESIEKIGLLSPPVVDNDNFLVVGNHRRLALVQLGYTEIPVIRKDFSKEYSELAEIDENLNFTNDWTFKQEWSGKDTYVFVIYNPTNPDSVITWNSANPVGQET
mgnify:CR=1 FL=1